MQQQLLEHRQPVPRQLPTWACLEALGGLPLQVRPCVLPRGWWLADGAVLRPSAPGSAGGAYGCPDALIQVAVSRESLSRVGCCDGVLKESVVVMVAPR